MWNKLDDIYGGDDNVRRAKVESLRGQFDHMRMREDQNVAKYVERIKASVNATRASGGEIKEETVVTKILRTFLPIFSIRVSIIQEVICHSNNMICLDVLVRRLTVFELDNFDNYVPASKNVEFLLRPNFHSKKKERR